MRQRLIAHPTTLCGVVDEIETEVLRSASDQLSLRYVLAGDVNELLIPAQTFSSREDELWQQTCFELFIGAEGSA